MDVLTAEQSRNARDELGLSQRAVASATGLPRNILNLFELQRVLPTGDFLDTLREFYIERGAELPELDDDDPPEPQPADPADPRPDPENPPRPGSPDVRVIDGIAVPVGIPEERVEALLDELADIDEEIDGMLDEPVDFPGYSVFSGPSERAQENQKRLRVLMARSYCIIRELQGRDAIGPCTAPVGEFVEGGATEDQRGWLRQVFGDFFGFLSPDDEPDAPTVRPKRNVFGMDRTRPRECGCDLDDDGNGDT